MVLLFLLGEEGRGSYDGFVLIYTHLRRCYLRGVCLGISLWLGGLILAFSVNGLVLYTAMGYAPMVLVTPGPSYQEIREIILTIERCIIEVGQYMSLQSLLSWLPTYGYVPVRVTASDMPLHAQS